MKRKLIETLASVGKPTEIWTGENGSSAILLPHGGRILGLFAPQSEENFLWTHPALASADTARAFFESLAWHNPGGDRTWLSPEIDFFLPQYPDISVYLQPREFDARPYDICKCDGDLILKTSFRVKMSRSQASPEVRITKRIKSAPNPLREQFDTKTASLEFAGYSLTTRLEILQNPASDRMNLWTLLQLPHGGEMIISTYSLSPVIRYFGNVETTELDIHERCIRYRMHAQGDHKLGIPALTAAGRVGYIHESECTATLVVRNINVNPSADYLDTPWSAPQTMGCAVQACNVNGEWGTFSELEHHAPGVGGSSGPLESEDSSQVWAYRGSPDHVKHAAGILLGTML